MKKKIADMWVKALRSGEYEQAVGTLVEVDHDNGDILGHCCLGVLCELAVKEGVKVDRKDTVEIVEDGCSHFTMISFDGSEAVLPDSVQKWAGMGSHDGGLPGRDVDEEGYPIRESLASMNDAGAPFEKIANLIESEYKSL